MSPKTITNLLLTAALVLALGAAKSFATQCPTSHCSAHGVEIIQMCQKIATKYNMPMAEISIAFLLEKGGACDCPCSCYAAGATASLKESDVLVEEIRKGAQFRTPVGAVAANHALGSKVENYPTLTLGFDNGKKVQVSENHPFVIENGIVTEAGKLSVGSTVTGENGGLVKVVDVKASPYTGMLYNFILAGKQPNGEDRIVYTSGVQSADWTVQSFHDLARSNVALKQLVSQIKE